MNATIEGIAKKMQDEDREYLYVVLKTNGEVEKDSQLRPRIYQSLKQAQRCLKTCCLPQERDKYFVAVYQICDIVPINEVIGR